MKSLDFIQKYGIDGDNFTNMNKADFSKSLIDEVVASSWGWAIIWLTVVAVSFMVVFYSLLMIYHNISDAYDEYQEWFFITLAIIFGIVLCLSVVFAGICIAHANAPQIYLYNRGIQ